MSSENKSILHNLNVTVTFEKISNSIICLTTQIHASPKVVLPVYLYVEVGLLEAAPSSQGCASDSDSGESGAPWGTREGGTAEAPSSTPTFAQMHAQGAAWSPEKAAVLGQKGKALPFSSRPPGQPQGLAFSLRGLSGAELPILPGGTPWSTQAL